jgi:hypothetical protein
MNVGGKTDMAYNIVKGLEFVTIFTKLQCSLYYMRQNIEGGFL